MCGEDVAWEWVDGGFEMEAVEIVVAVVGLVVTSVSVDGDRFVGGSGGVVARLRCLDLLLAL